MTGTAFDVAIIGAGHNGLVCAFYLARAGLKVIVLERRDIVGGAAVTEEFHPGFRNSVASYTVSLLQPKIISDLALHEHGLRIVHRKLANFLPTADGRYLAVGGGRTKSEVAKFSLKDAERLDDYDRRLAAVADLIRALMLEIPPNVSEGGLLSALPELLRASHLARRMGKLDLTAKRDLLALLGSSAGDFLDNRFESDPIKAVYGFDGIVGNYASPYTPGSGYVLLHHVLGEVNGVRGAWGHALGGMGAITQAMAKACAARGVDIRLRAPVREVLVEKRRVAGVVCDDGDTIRARAIISNLNPKLLFQKLVDPALLPEEFRERIHAYRMGSGTFRMNVALSELPRFTCLPEPGDHLTAGIIIGPSLAYMDTAFREARLKGWSQNPVVEILIPSTLDDGLAPKGAHVASLFYQHVAPVLPGGASWDDHRDEVAKLMISVVDRYAPGFAGSVLGRQVLSPLDLERIFGLTAGDIMHGHLALDQLFSARPVLGHGNYRMPVEGLYLCGSGAHPGGGVTGAPGHNCAQAVLMDLGRRRRI
ncbi:MAG TPA: NAD(P)/FAD-dependent oxidoreductase [Rhizomicrobium sp.]|nr:NAD(P)/FAD-dependent oxidoreductase [Rhizomicrobium sp.]